MDKIALVFSNNLCFCPYVSIYLRYLEKWNVNYDLISWNRNGKIESGYQFNSIEKSRNPFAILWGFLKFAHFAINVVNKNKYDKLVVFDSQLGIFLSVFLYRKFKRKYIFDYRDLSIEQKSAFSLFFKLLLSNSYANVISSPGFKPYLPREFRYVVSHNFNQDLALRSMDRDQRTFKGDIIKVLTIGAIRVDSNYEVIDAFGDQDAFELFFVGKGLAAPVLEKYSKDKGYNNVFFSGFYKKEDECNIIQRHTCINIIYPLIPSHIAALSNRFYNSLIYRRPMIVRKGTIQGNYAEKYKVGLVIDNCSNLSTKLKAYLKDLNFEEYNINCKRLLGVFIQENKEFEEVLKNFLSEEYNN